jgi:hypothetical protein
MMDGHAKKHSLAMAECLFLLRVLKVLTVIASAAGARQSRELEQKTPIS